MVQQIGGIAGIGRSPPMASGTGDIVGGIREGAGRRYERRLSLHRKQEDPRAQGYMLLVRSVRAPLHFRLSWAAREGKLKHGGKSTNLSI